jgi:type I restriction enzyme, R subunit
MDKRSLTRTRHLHQFITPALQNARCDEMMQIGEEVTFTKGRIIVRGKLVRRGRAKRADYVLYFKRNIPLALIEAKDNSHAVGDGMQQGLAATTATCQRLLNALLQKALESTAQVPEAAE